MFDMVARKIIRSYNHDKIFGEPIKVIMDPSCTYVVCSFSNKSICIYDLITGEMVAKATGHAEIVTGVIFLPDCKHIVSVDGNGCVFVWKLPAPLSSKILKRIMGKNNPLSPRSSVQPLACNHLSFCKKECQRSKISPENVWSRRNNSQSGDGVVYPEGNHRKSSSFKFSVSRLPKWAQAKVNSSHNVCNNLSCTSSEAYTPSSPEVQTPFDPPSPSPDTVNSQTSSMSGGTYSNIALDNMWHSVYTVCMEALSSPEMQNLCGTKFPEIRQDRDVICEDQNFFGLNSLSKDQKTGLVSEQYVGCNNNDVSRCSEEVSDSKAEQLYLNESGSVSKTAIEENLGSLLCEEDSDMFKQHFGSLSNTHKTKSRNPLVRRFSARYIVQWDYPGDCRKLFSSPARRITDRKSCEHEIATHIISEDRFLQVKEIEEVRSSSEQDQMNSAQCSADSTCESIKLPVKESSVDKGSDLGETIVACKEAFGSLDAAAESVVQLLVKLEKSYGEKVWTEAGAQFFDEAAEQLPLIVEKVNAIAKLVQCRKNSKCESRISVSEMNQLFGRFAGGRSDNIMETPKDDTSSIH